MKHFIRTALTSCLLGVSALTFMGCSGANNSAPAENLNATWELSNKDSHISYVTIKQGDIAEVNTFALFTGRVTPTGDAEINIALNSLQTNIDTRDMRMKKIVFKTEEFPMATLTAKIPMADFENLKPGNRQAFETAVSVSLAGVSESFDAMFQITRIGANTVLVDSQEPIMVQTSDFGFVESVAELQRLAKLDSITPVVPVSFSLLFKR